jgi:hypothetical protein
MIGFRKFTTKQHSEAGAFFFGGTVAGKTFLPAYPVK